MRAWPMAGTTACSRRGRWNMQTVAGAGGGSCSAETCHALLHGHPRPPWIRPAASPVERKKLDSERGLPSVSRRPLPLGCRMKKDNSLFHFVRVVVVVMSASCVHWVAPCAMNKLGAPARGPPGRRSHAGGGGRGVPGRGLWPPGHAPGRVLVGHLPGLGARVLRAPGRAHAPRRGKRWVRARAGRQPAAACSYGGGMTALACVRLPYTRRLCHCQNRVELQAPGS